MNAKERRPASGRGDDLGKNAALGYEATPSVTRGADAAWIASHPERWRVYLLGYEHGVTHGFGRGVDHANEMWTNVTSEACRAGLVLIDLAERQRTRRITHSFWCNRSPLEVRRRCDGSCYEPLSPEEIQRRARESWGGAA